jgi:hypothetical protein
MQNMLPKTEKQIETSQIAQGGEGPGHHDDGRRAAGVFFFFFFGDGREGVTAVSRTRTVGTASQSTRIWSAGTGSSLVIKIYSVLL